MEAKAGVAVLQDGLGRDGAGRGLVCLLASLLLLPRQLFVDGFRHCLLLVLVLLVFLVLVLLLTVREH